MSDQHDSHAYWRATMGLLTKVLIIWALVSYGAGILFADVLDKKCSFFIGLRTHEASQ